VDLPEDMHVRSVLLRKRHRLRVRSVAVLLRPEADSPTVTGLWQESFPGEAPYDVFRYRVVRIWQIPAEQLLAGGVGTLPLAPISAVSAAELPELIARMAQRLQSRRLRRYAEEVWSETYILLGLRYSPEFAQQLLRGVRAMKESSTYQAILEEGEAEGKRKGEAIGMRKGEQQGALAEARKILRIQGEARFGAPNPQSAAVMDSLNQLGQLEQLLVRLHQCASWDELLEGVHAGRTSRRRRKFVG
jgi:hypothetical protein